MNNKKSLIALALVALIGIVGGTYAYFTSRATLENEFVTGIYSTSVKEQFISPDNWTPGTTTEKKINVTNNGNVDVAVRATYQESWLAADGVTVLTGERNGERVALFAVGEDWESSTDGWYYYNKDLAEGETSSNFIEAVTFNPNFELEEGVDIECTTTKEDGKVKHECKNLETGYSGATYTLAITIETIQADQRWNHARQLDLYETLASKSEGSSNLLAISTTMNDEHPIYYYTGTVEDNNALFAGYCWKIVRTTETGGVKLLYNGEPAGDGSCNNTGEASQLSTKSKFSSRSGYEGFGYMYNATSGTPEELLSATDVNKNNSAIKTVVDNWYAANMTDYTEYLEDTIYCNDRSISGDGLPYLAGHDRHGYEYAATLECPNKLDSFTLKVENGGTVGYGNNALEYPVGLITLDEAMYAGGYQGYLNTGTDYWTMTPSYLDGDGPIMYMISTYGIENGTVAYYPAMNKGVRPMISLRSGMGYLEGLGTTDKPYIITEVK